MTRSINTLVEPWDYKTEPNPAALYFQCPHCNGRVEQSAQNFHYWCNHCGRNATQTTGSINLGPPSGEWASQSIKIEKVWHRILLRTNENVEMRCGLRILEEDGESALSLESFAKIDKYCPTCFYVPPS